VSTWREVPDDRISRPEGLGWVRLGWRGVLLVLVIYGLLVPFWITRLLRLNSLGQYVVQLACRAALAIMGIPLVRHGEPMRHAGAVVCNHASWLDIFSLNAAQRVYFVSKAEVSKWPGIGLLARSTGTVFIERNATQARQHKSQLTSRLLAGDRLLFFPEGTSTDGRRVLPFRSSLFAAFFEPSVASKLWIQPVTVNYVAPVDESAHFYGWWGGMDFAPHLMKILAARRQGRVEVTFHAPQKVSDFSNRKELARACEDLVRSALAG
jgi:lyso-ornithine lipid O-acyltransferase